jgi:hypothetical protein
MDTDEEIAPILTELSFEKKCYEFIVLLFSGKLYLSKWLSYGDDFNVTASEYLDFTFPFDRLSPEDSKELHNLYQQYVKELPHALQFKLNCGKNVGAYNTSLLWFVTDKSDAIFLKYITDNPIYLQDQIESHIIKCVVSNKV